MADRYDRLVADYLNGVLTSRIRMMEQWSKDHKLLPILQYEYDSVQNAFVQLPSHQQEALQEKYVEKKNMEIIASDFFVDKATVHRWKRCLKKEIGNQLDRRI